MLLKTVILTVIGVSTSLAVLPPEAETAVAPPAAVASQDAGAFGDADLCSLRLTGRPADATLDPVRQDDLNAFLVAMNQRWEEDYTAFNARVVELTTRAILTGRATPWAPGSSLTSVPDGLATRYQYSDGGWYVHTVFPGADPILDQAVESLHAFEAAVEAEIESFFAN